MGRLRCLVMVFAILAGEPRLPGQRAASAAENIPPDCDRPELLSLGRPHMSPGAKSPRLGLSMKSERYRRGEPVLLYIWADNPTDEVVPLYTCTDLESFKQRGFDVYDGKGRPLVRKKETDMRRNSRKKVDPCIGFPWTCARDLMLHLEPHSCVNRADFDFSMDLADQYNLRPGTYTVRLRASGDRSETNCGATHPRLRINSLTDMTFVVKGP